MNFKCQACGYIAEIPERYLGKTVTCPKCKASVDVMGLPPVATQREWLASLDGPESSLVQPEPVVDLPPKEEVSSAGDPSSSPSTKKRASRAYLAASLLPWLLAATIEITYWGATGETAAYVTLIGSLAVIFLSLAVGILGIVVILVTKRNYIATAIALLPALVLIILMNYEKWFGS